METRQAMLEHLKRYAPCSIRDFTGALGVSENAVRHHLAHFEIEGLVESARARDGVGRPAKVYTLTRKAEGMFPKRYQELLELVLEEASGQGTLEPLLEGVAQNLARGLVAGLDETRGEDRLHALIERLDYGGMLGTLNAHEAGWELRAYNCFFYDVGCKFEAVCDLMPRVLTLATGLESERPVCQRDGRRACSFVLTKQ